MADRMLGNRLGGRNRFRSRSLGAAAGALAASGAATPASATIIYGLSLSYSPNDSFDLTGNISSQIDLFTMTGMMGELDLGFDAPAGGMMAPGSTVEFSVFNVGMGMVDYLSLFAPGDTVDGSLSFAEPAYLVENSVPNPDWTAGSIGYAGFTFDPGTGPLYGWLEVQFDASGTDFTVLGWAYEDDVGVGSILVPEPGLALLLGLGFAGLAAGCCRRLARASRPAD